MIQGASGGVFIYKGKGWAGYNHAGINAKTQGDALCQPGLAAPQGTRQGDDIPGLEERTDLPSELMVSLSERV